MLFYNTHAASVNLQISYFVIKTVLIIFKNYKTVKYQKSNIFTAFSLIMLKKLYADLL